MLLYQTDELHIQMWWLSALFLKSRNKYLRNRNLYLYICIRVKLCREQALIKSPGPERNPQDTYHNGCK